MEIPLVIGVAVIALAAINGTKIVPENHRLAIFRLGRLIGVRGPGLLLVVPLVDKSVIVDQTRLSLGGKRFRSNNLTTGSSQSL